MFERGPSKDRVYHLLFIFAPPWDICWLLNKNPGFPLVSKNRTISSHLPTKFATDSQNQSECFYDFRFTSCGYDVPMCGGMKIDQITRAAHISDKFIHSFKQNIKYNYFIGLCRYKSRDTLSRRRQFQSGDCFFRSAVE